MARLQFRARHKFASGFALDAAFDLDEGVTALFGPSGSGKSTTLGIIAGTLRPQAGKVQLGERVLLDTARGIALAPERRAIGCVFQNQRLFPHLTVADNLRYGLRRQPARSVEFARVTDVLELGKLLGRYPRSLSGGEQQRAAIGRAVLRGPELLLLDEPLTGLDAELKDRVLVYLERALAEWRIPTLLVSHDQFDVRRLAERIVILTSGSVLAAGPTPATLDHAIFNRRVSIETPINMVRVTEARNIGGHAEGKLGSQTIHLPQALGDHQATVRIRFLPSDVTLSRNPVPGISIRNQLRGTVAEIVARGDLVFVRADVGEMFWAEITADALAELDLAVGQPVTCLIKASALHIIDGS
jgi:molybdate transport system ATP-binding protein